MKHNKLHHLHQQTSHHALMIQGTNSDAGKSTLVAGLCRVLYRRGLSVAPFKSQNMALNSAVTENGGEIGRAQAVQAQAAGIKPHTDMNPILIKPSSDTQAQIIVNGQALKTMHAKDYQKFRPTALETAVVAYQRLSQQYGHVIIEGAGSPAEVNLRKDDVANMGLAEAIDCPVLLAGDIDRGGVFAQFLGTLQCLSTPEQNRIAGFIINRFRGDYDLLRPGIEWLEQRCGKPVLGVIPYLHGLHIEAEDAINTQQPSSSPQKSSQAILRVVVPVLPHISNHTDFDVLRLHPQVDLQFVGPDTPIPAADLVILPGSKNVRQDLKWLSINQWPQYLKRHLRYGGKLLGICGGYQMLGTQINDPDGLEGAPGNSGGLELLNIETTLESTKQLRHASGRLNLANSDNPDTDDEIRVYGYEIHMGTTRVSDTLQPLIRPDHCESPIAGAVSADQQIAGTYLHGLFDAPQACNSLLRWAGLTTKHTFDYAATCEQQLERLADCLESHLDIPSVLTLLQGETQ